MILSENPLFSKSLSANTSIKHIKYFKVEKDLLNRQFLYQLAQISLQFQTRMLSARMEEAGDRGIATQLILAEVLINQIIWEALLTPI